MEQVPEFFFNLFYMIWINIEGLIDPLMNFLQNFTSIFITAITNLLSWILNAVDWIIGVFTAIGDFFSW